MASTSTSNPNIRTLLRHELSSRRITHPHASYSTTKTPLLSCTVCHLVIRSETLWDGHLRSANHRRNVQSLQIREREVNGDGREKGSAKGESRKRKAEEVDQDAAEDLGPGRPDEVQREMRTSGRKRKVDDVDNNDPLQDQGGPDGIADGRKKTKSQPAHSSTPSTTTRVMPGFVAESTEDAPAVRALSEKSQPLSEQSSELPQEPLQVSPSGTKSPPPPSARAPAPAPAPSPQVDEDEWAAFERDVIPLANNSLPTAHHLHAATISAAPMSASDLAAQRAAEEEEKGGATGRSRAEQEAEAEREDEGRRLEEEFEVQEQMEERVRRLRKKLMAIKGDGGMGGGVALKEDAGAPSTETEAGSENDDDDDDDDEEGLDDFDEWRLLQ